MSRGALLLGGFWREATCAGLGGGGELASSWLQVRPGSDVQLSSPATLSADWKAYPLKNSRSYLFTDHDLSEVFSCPVAGGKEVCQGGSWTPKKWAGQMTRDKGAGQMTSEKGAGQMTSEKGAE